MRIFKGNAAGKVVFWLTASISLLLLPVISLYFLVIFGVFGHVPEKDELKFVKNDLASELYTADSVLIGKYYIENRINTELHEIPPGLIQALISTEDIRFYDHHGIDTKSLARVFIKSILLGNKSAGGGSTISQQLAKNLYKRKDYGILSMPVNKIREYIIATRLEDAHSKENVLKMYLNTVSFSENTYGIETAAKRFFNKSLNQLGVEESALLIGMLKAPTLYNPRINPDGAKDRRNIVLSQMAKYNFIEERQKDSLQALEINLNYTPLEHDDGIAAYFRESVRKELEKQLADQSKEDGSKYNIYSDGLKIYTTLNFKIQQHARNAVNQHLAKLQQEFDDQWSGRHPLDGKNELLKKAIKRSERYRHYQEAGLTSREIDSLFKVPTDVELFTWKGPKHIISTPYDSILHAQKILHSGFIVLDPTSGNVLAWVGGINFKHFKYDHILARRQVGSTFKPIVYAAALEQGIQPCEFFRNEQKVYTSFENWSPANSNHQYGGKYSMKGALANSVNVVSVELLFRTGLNNTIKLARNLGINSYIKQVPSIALGTPELSLMEMTGAYCTFANNGEYHKPNMIQKVLDHQDNVIIDNTRRSSSKQVIGRKNAQIMTEMLQDVVNYGTAYPLRTKYHLKSDLAGKTGTTQSYADGWFIGFTPTLVGGAWVGAESPHVHFKNHKQGNGSYTALPIWALFLKNVYNDPEFADKQFEKFPSPDQQVRELISCRSYVEDTFFDKLFRVFRKKRVNSR